jgi:hypothetical protein
MGAAPNQFRAGGLTLLLSTSCTHNSVVTVADAEMLWASAIVPVLPKS